MKINVQIVDDEPYAVRLLENYIEQFNLDIELLPPVHTMDDAIAAINENKPDILLLDVQLKNKTGFDVLEAIKEQPMVIFTTAYDDYAIKAIKHKAFDYIMKPIDIDELKNALENAISELKKNESQGIVDDQYHIQKLKVSRGKLVSISEIVRCEAESNYCRVHFKNGKNYLMSKPLKMVEQMIDSPAFIRTHQSHLVNMTYVVSIDGNTVHLDSGSIPVSRARKEDFLERVKLLRELQH